MRVTGLTHSDFTGDMPGRHAGGTENGRPKFKTHVVNRWLMEQITFANQHRQEVLDDLRNRKKKRGHGKSARKHKGGRHNHTSSSGGSASDSSSGFSGIGHDHHDFRVVAYHQPGALFATVTADFRSRLGARGLDYDVGPRGPVYRKWLESCFTPRFLSRGQMPRLESKRDEVTMLVKALDELSRGRMVEVADILGTRLRQLVFNIETPGQDDVGKQLLSYEQDEHPTISRGVVDTAIRLEQASRKREDRLYKVSKRSRTADR